MDSSEDEELFITQSSTKADISAEIPGFRKTMVSSQDEGLFIYYTELYEGRYFSRNGRLCRVTDITVSALILYRLLKAGFPFSFQVFSRAKI